MLIKSYLLFGFLFCLSQSLSFELLRQEPTKPPTFSNPTLELTNYGDIDYVVKIGLGKDGSLLANFSINTASAITWYGITGCTSCSVNNTLFDPLSKTNGANGVFQSEEIVQKRFTGILEGYLMDTNIFVNGEQTNIVMGAGTTCTYCKNLPAGGGLGLGNNGDSDYAIEFIGQLIKKRIIQNSTFGIQL